MDLSLLKFHERNSYSHSPCASETSTQKLLNDEELSASLYNDIDDSDTNTFSTSPPEGYVCTRCNSVFRHKHTLDIHKKTSIKCLRSDSSSVSSSSSDNAKRCEYCEKSFASKQMRLYHETKCIKKIIFDMNKKHDLEINYLKNEIEKLKKT